MVAIQIETPQGGGVSVPLAQAHLQPGVYKRFQLTRQNDYALARVSGEAMKAAEGDDGTLVQLWTREMDGAILTIKRAWATQFWRSGTGSRGQISAGTNTQTNALTLNTVTDIVGFAVGMTLQATSTDGGTLRGAGANLIVTQIDRLNGILYFAGANSQAVIAALAPLDFLLREGDNNAVIHGMGAWCPQVAITNSDLFNGLNRYTDPVRLSGQYFNAQGMTLREMTIEAMSRIDVEGGEPDVAWFHPRDRSTLTKEFEGKSLYFKDVETMGKIPGSDAVAGFGAIEAEFDGQRLTVMSSINVPRGQVFVGQWDTVGLDTLGPFPHIIDYDTLDFVRVYNDDSFEVRVAGRGDIEVLAPAYWAHAYNVGS